MIISYVHWPTFKGQFVIPLALGNKHLQYLMNTFPAQPVTINESLTYLLKLAMICESGCIYPPLLQYTTAIPFSLLLSINGYGFHI